MVSLFRLKGRALQIDNMLIMTLSFCTGVIILFTVNFLPVIYERFFESLFVFERAILSDYINLIFAFSFFVTAFGFYFSVRLGTKRYLLKKTLKKKPTARDIFFYFRPKKYFSAFFYCIKTAFVKLILFSFCFLPSFVCLVIVERFSHQGVSALVCFSLAVTAVCLFMNGGVFYSLFNSSFFLCDYYFIDGKYLSFRHLVSCSQTSMRKKYALLTRLKLSFIGWFVLCLLILPIPYVWGYYNQSLAVAAAEFMNEKQD